MNDMKDMKDMMDKPNVTGAPSRGAAISNPLPPRNLPGFRPGATHAHGTEQTITSKKDMPDPYLSHLLSLSGPAMHRALAFAHVVQALGPLLVGSMAAPERERERRSMVQI